MSSAAPPVPVELANDSKGQHSKERKKQRTRAETLQEIKDNERSTIPESNPLLAAATLAPRALGCPASASADAAPLTTEGNQTSQCQGYNNDENGNNNSTKNVMRIFMDGLRVVTWNTTALFAQSGRAASSRARCRIVRSLTLSADIVCLQETHGNSDDIKILQDEIPDFLLLGSSHDNPAAGGMLTMINRKLMVHPQAPLHTILDAGRCTSTTIFNGLLPITIINVHIPPIYEAQAKKELLHKIASDIKDSDSIIFLMGDFNFIASEEYRFDPTTVTNLPADHSLALYFDGLFPKFCELHQGDFTRRQIRHNQLATLSRLDRIYTNLSAAHLQELRPHTRITHLLTDPRIMSDHVPVASHLRAPRMTPPPRPRIKPWITRLPNFCRHIDTAILDSLAPLDGLNAITVVRDIFATATKNILSGHATDDPSTTYEKLHWAILLLRARQGDSRHAESRALARYPSLRMLSLDHDDSALTDLIASLARKSITDQMSEIAADPHTTEMKKISKKEAIRRKAAAWAPSRRTAKTLAILNDQGLPAASSEAGADLLRTYWTATFTAKPADASDFRFLDQHIQAAPNDIVWHMDFEAFEDMLMAMDDSAPGPDGITYSALQRAPDVIHHHLYACYEDFLADRDIPHDFNESYLIFLPKGEVDADIFHTARTPDTTRPLNLTNTTAKLVAAALNRSLAAVAACTVIGQQRGFIKGRCLIDNVIEVDDFLIRAAKYYNDKHGLALLDFKAAFPSLSQHWIFHVLEFMNLPEFITTALKRLYSNCYAAILFNGEVYDGINITSGIKQGCPASGSLFALSLDPFIRHLLVQLPMPVHLIVAFADDIAIASRQLMKALPIILREFRRLAKIMTLFLNMTKCKFIPYWQNGIFDTKRFITDNLPEMMAAEVCSSGTLLGVLLGPGAEQRVMTPAASKFWHRALEARSLMTSFKHSLRHYSVFAFPVLSYIVQYAAVPPCVLQQERRALQLLPRAPWNSIPANTLQHLKDLHFTYEAPSLSRTALAAAFRAAVKSPAFQRLRDQPEPPEDDLDQLLHPRSPDWIQHSPMTHLTSIFHHILHIYPNLPPDPLQDIQRRLLVLIRETAESPVQALLQRRLTRFDINLTDEQFHNIQTNFKQIGSESSDRLRWATLVITLNAIPTAARMQSASRACLFCDSVNDDRVEHLLHCPAMAPILTRHFPSVSALMGPVLGNQRVTGVRPMAAHVAKDAFLYNAILVEAHRLRRHGSSECLDATARAALRAHARRAGHTAAEQQ
jgi:endonuclease/exonuclease/phosphatase family metal-dependent hydrolase